MQLAQKPHKAHSEVFELPLHVEKNLVPYTISINDFLKEKLHPNWSNMHSQFLSASINALVSTHGTDDEAFGHQLLRGQSVGLFLW